MKPIQTALISAYYKEPLKPLLQTLYEQGIQFISTGGTHRFIQEQGYEARLVEDLTDYPAILGGRVKTLHPQVFGGILGRRDQDQATINEYNLPLIDLVIIDCYPFEEAVSQGQDPDTMVETIDIGGIALIRAAAKNYQEVTVIPSSTHYAQLYQVLAKQKGYTTLEQRQYWASQAFAFTARYDTLIQQQLSPDSAAPANLGASQPLRYGENPHQKASFHGNFETYFDQLSGKQLSYNNLVDVDAAVRLAEDLPPHSFTVIKHTNPCGAASRASLKEAWDAAYSADPVSAFGGILATNTTVDKATAEAIGDLFFEVMIAPGFEEEALNLLKQKQNRILLKQKKPLQAAKEVRSVLDGVLQQDRDTRIETHASMKVVTDQKPMDGTSRQELTFANAVVKHAKSNAIALTYNHQLVGIGVGQTSRVDALHQAIAKARYFQLPLSGATMASDAFFPFADSVQIAQEAGIRQVIQPGGSKRDQESIDYCNQQEMAMVFTGVRHFKH